MLSIMLGNGEDIFQQSQVPSMLAEAVHIHKRFLFSCRHHRRIQVERCHLIVLFQTLLGLSSIRTFLFESLVLRWKGLQSMKNRAILKGLKKRYSIDVYTHRSKS